MDLVSIQFIDLKILFSSTRYEVFVQNYQFKLKSQLLLDFDYLV